MPSIKRNLIANFTGNGWVLLLSFAFVPLYVKFLGIEAYGLIGFFASLQAILFLFDMGLSFAINRELARLSVRNDAAQEMRHLLRTLECVYWAVGVLIAIVVVSLSPIISAKWVNSVQLSVREMCRYLMLMGVVFAIRWPYALYSGALLGVQRLVALNSLRIAVETLRSLGSVLILWLVSPTLMAFLYWQLFVAILGTLGASLMAWKSLPAAHEPARFMVSQLKRVWRFALGSSGIGLTVLILRQMDKIVLSRLLSLENLGYYMLACAVASGLSQLTSPIFSVFYPRLSQMVAGGNAASLPSVYHRGCQFMSLVLLPIGVILTLFSYEILLLWSRSPVIAERTHMVLSILVAGTMLNGMMQIPYALQLAYGWTRLALVCNAISIVILVPSIFFMVKFRGKEGAAMGWFLLNVGYFVVSAHFMYKKLLSKEKWAWYVKDVGFPMVVISCAGGLFRAFTPTSISNTPAISLLFVCIAYVIVFCIAVLSIPWSRRFIRSIISPQNVLQP